MERLRGGLNLETDSELEPAADRLGRHAGARLGLGMNPFNSPNSHCDGDSVEVRVSRATFSSRSKSS